MGIDWLTTDVAIGGCERALYTVLEHGLQVREVKSKESEKMDSIALNLTPYGVR